MPKWLSSLLIVVGFFALIGLALLPRTVEVTVNVKDDIRNNTVHHHGAPALTPSDDHQIAGNKTEKEDD